MTNAELRELRYNVERAARLHALAVAEFNVAFAEACIKRQLPIDAQIDIWAPDLETETT
jgi:hypothetical protein